MVTDQKLTMTPEAIGRAALAWYDDASRLLEQILQALGEMDESREDTPGIVALRMLTLYNLGIEDIAERMHYDPTTVRRHLQRGYHDLGLRLPGSVWSKMLGQEGTQYVPIRNIEDI